MTGFSRRFFLSLALAGLGGGLARSRAAQAASTDFQTWLTELRKDAAQAGIRRATLDAALQGVQPIERVLELDRRQPEFTMTFDQYQARVVNQARIDRGRVLLRENEELLNRVSARYGVPPRFIVSLWGIETDYGRITGNFKIVGALATLAYDGRRAAFFRKELIDALKILDRGDIAPDQMLGSWAGAMGQSQFMPSSYLAYAVDFDGDGRRDIWSSRPDVFGSIANYLAKVGWRGSENWGVRVVPPPNFDAVSFDQKQERPPAEWERLGFVRMDGQVSAHAPEQVASIILPGGADGPAYMTFGNYKVIMRWNRSNYFAVAVGTLADRIQRG
ncbi:MAG: lytic murein transglycosylase [Alphaproteobacteria bacterium]|nr:lytic murein transglycosylase [Alphaproteobacteria bacterium]